MADKITYHSAVTGKFVTKEYAEKNPDTTVELSNCNLSELFLDFVRYFESNKDKHPEKSYKQFIDYYLENK